MEEDELGFFWTSGRSVAGKKRNWVSNAYKEKKYYFGGRCGLPGEL